MKTKTKSMIFIFMGIFLITAGINMKNKKNMWDETVTKENVIPGTKARNAAVGAAVGGVGGGIIAAVVGGFGVVVAGTGFGLPAGAALIATAAAMGAGGGAIAGAATGNSESTSSQISTITHIVPAYETWLWSSVIGIGFILLIIAILELRKLTENSNIS